MQEHMDITCTISPTDHAHVVCPVSIRRPCRGGPRAGARRTCRTHGQDILWQGCRACGEQSERAGHGLIIPLSWLQLLVLLDWLLYNDNQFIHCVQVKMLIDFWGMVWVRSCLNLKPCWGLSYCALYLEVVAWCCLVSQKQAAAQNLNCGILSSKLEMLPFIKTWDSILTFSLSWGKSILGWENMPGETQKDGNKEM